MNRFLLCLALLISFYVVSFNSSCLSFIISCLPINFAVQVAAVPYDETRLIAVPVSVADACLVCPGELADSTVCWACAVRSSVKK
jgi:hypothetical protein